MTRRPTPAARVRSVIFSEVMRSLRHDLRNKLGSIRNAAFYVNKRLQAGVTPEQDPRIFTLLHLIQTELEAAEVILGRSAVVSGPADADDTLGECVQRLHQAFGARVTSAASVDDLASVPVPANLEVITSMLIENALETGPSTSVLLSAGRADGKLRLTLDDNGPGMDPERLEESLTRNRGTENPGHPGFALYVARRLTEACDGSLEVAAREGGGLRAAITLTERNR